MINIIDGDKRGSLIYNGVKQAIDFKEKPKLIIDIGGGVLNLLLQIKVKFFGKKLQLGAARLLELFKPKNPIELDDFNAIDSHLSNSLQDLFEMCETYEIDSLIGSSGSFDTLAEMISCRKGDCGVWKKNLILIFICMIIMRFSELYMPLL